MAAERREVKMIDYRGVYEDLLRMEARARDAGFTEFQRECFDFRVWILLWAGYSPTGWVSHA